MVASPAATHRAERPVVSDRNRKDSEPSKVPKQAAILSANRGRPEVRAERERKEQSPAAQRPRNDTGQNITCLKTRSKAQARPKVPRPECIRGTDRNVGVDDDKVARKGNDAPGPGAMETGRAGKDDEASSDEYVYYSAESSEEGGDESAGAASSITPAKAAQARYIAKCMREGETPR